MTPALQQSERSFQTAVIELAHTLHWRIFHVNDSRREVVCQDGAKFLVGDKETTGWPDLVCARERVFYAELKSDTGKLSKAQEEWLRVLEEAGQEVHVWRPRDFEQVQRVLTRRAA